MSLARRSGERAISTRAELAVASDIYLSMIPSADFKP
jgi:hypothetical protein